jgi:large subunit ribosomal protein L10
MNKKDKFNLVEKIESIIKDNSVLFLVDYRGLKDCNLYLIRRSLKSIGCGMIISKNTLARIAFIRSNRSNSIIEKLKGPIAILYSNDIFSSSKLIAGFISEYENLNFVGASFENKFIDLEFVKLVASLGSETEIKSRFLSIIKAPASRLISILHAKKSNVDILP